jgi:tetratricopeptide (TPR) repeat protein
MSFFSSKKNRWLLAALVAGILILYQGIQLATWRSAEIAYYNQGLVEYQNGDFQKAVQMFDRSYAAFKAEEKADWLHRFIYPAPDRRVAALANFQKAKALLHLQQGQPAVDAFKESLKLNPGNDYEDLALTAANQLHEDALVVKYDLELLFKNNPSLAQGQGKGKGKGQGKPGNQQVPGQDPGTKPGKGNRDDI